MKEIEGFPGYFVTEDGRVWSAPKKSAGGHGGKWLRFVPAGAGYLAVNLFRNKKSHKVYVHRLVAKTFIPNPVNKPQVNHKNGIKTDCNVDNIEWATHAENNQHKYDVLGLVATGWLKRNRNENGCFV